MSKSIWENTMTGKGYDVNEPNKDGDISIEWEVDCNIIWLSKSDLEMMLRMYEGTEGKP